MTSRILTLLIQDMWHVPKFWHNGSLGYIPVWLSLRFGALWHCVGNYYFQDLAYLKNIQYVAHGGLATTKQTDIFQLVWLFLVPFCFIMFAITSWNLHNSILFLLCQSFIVNTFFFNVKIVQHCQYDWLWSWNDQTDILTSPSYVLPINVKYLKFQRTQN